MAISKKQKEEKIIPENTTPEWSLNDFTKSMGKEYDGFVLDKSPFAVVKEWINTGNYILNAQIGGSIFKGIPSGRVTMLNGEEGCLHPDQKITVFIDDKNITSSIKDIMDNYTDKRIYIDSFDGYVEIIRFVQKPEIQIHQIKTENCSIRVASNHRIESKQGWVFAKDIKAGMKIPTDKGMIEKITENIIEDEKSYVLDFEVDNPNHRYFCGGFSNHNTGKTYVALNVAANAQKEGYHIIWLDTENALTMKDAVNLGVDPTKLLHVPINTVEKVINYISKMLDIFKHNLEKNIPNPKIMIILDSMGNLSTTKEMEDSVSMSDKKDMTRPAQLKRMFRVITSDLGLLQIPMIVINHIYDVIGAYMPTKEVGGGSGGKYNASTMLMFSKGKLKDSAKKNIGIILTSKIKKSRFTKGNIEARIHISFDKGMNPYIGLDNYLDWENIGVFPGKYENGDIITSSKPRGFAVRHLKKTIPASKLFTPEVFNQETLEKIDEKIKPIFSFEQDTNYNVLLDDIDDDGDDENYDD